MLEHDQITFTYLTSSDDHSYMSSAKRLQSDSLFLQILASIHFSMWYFLLRFPFVKLLGKLAIEQLEIVYRLWGSNQLLNQSVNQSKHVYIAPY